MAHFQHLLTEQATERCVAAEQGKETAGSWSLLPIVSTDDSTSTTTSSASTASFSRSEFLAAESGFRGAFETAFLSATEEGTTRNATFAAHYKYRSSMHYRVRRHTFMRFARRDFDKETAGRETDKTGPKPPINFAKNKTRRRPVQIRPKKIPKPRFKRLK